MKKTQVDLQRTVGGIHMTCRVHSSADRTCKAFNYFCCVITNMHSRMVCVSFKYPIPLSSKTKNFDIMLNPVTGNTAKQVSSTFHNHIIRYKDSA